MQIQFLVLFPLLAFAAIDAPSAPIATLDSTTSLFVYSTPLLSPPSFTNTSVGSVQPGGPLSTPNTTFTATSTRSGGLPPITTDSGSVTGSQTTAGAGGLSTSVFLTTETVSGPNGPSTITSMVTASISIATVGGGTPSGSAGAGATSTVTPGLASSGGKADASNGWILGAVIGIVGMVF